jgi:hypothetical protein
MFSGWLDNCTFVYVLENRYTFQTSKYVLRKDVGEMVHKTRSLHSTCFNFFKILNHVCQTVHITFILTGQILTR